MRLTLLAAKQFGLSRRNVKIALKDGLFKLNGAAVKSDILTSETDILEYLGEKTDISFNINDYIILKNSDVCFIYKPAFMHSERLKPSDSLTASDIWSAMPEYQPLSRLDYEVDGVLGGAAHDLKINFLEKKYLAIVSGELPDKIALDHSIDAYKTKKVKIIENGEGYPTLMEKLHFNGQYSLISVTLAKAARHQVRAFCAYLGHPILGDTLYGGEEFQRVCLHCSAYKINGYSASSGNFATIFADLVDFNNEL